MLTISPIGWESEEAQKKFQSGPDFGPAMEAFKPHLRSGEKPTAYFVHFTPYAPKEIIDAARTSLFSSILPPASPLTSLLSIHNVLTSTVVQLITISGSSAREDNIRASLSKYSSVEGCTGVAGGYATSDVEGEKTFVGIMGWSTLEASAAGKSSISIQAEGGSVEEHHVNFRYPIKGFRGL